MSRAFILPGLAENGSHQKELMTLRSQIDYFDAKLSICIKNALAEQKHPLSLKHPKNRNPLNLGCKQDDP